MLERVTGGDHGHDGLLAVHSATALTGDTSEEVLFFAHGPTATGKSSTLEAIKAALGEYAATADFETFLKRHGDAGIRNDIARLAGARFVVSIEVDEGKALAEGLVKMLTGGDTVAARFLYRETFEFLPVFKLWLAANTRPRASADDGAIWRRILQVPFAAVIPEAERDERVKITLRTSPEVQTAILAWAVQGCLEWQQAGLAAPSASATTPPNTEPKTTRSATGSPTAANSTRTHGRAITTSASPTRPGAEPTAKDPPARTSSPPRSAPKAASRKSVNKCADGKASMSPNTGPPGDSGTARDTRFRKLPDAHTREEVVRKCRPRCPGVPRAYREHSGHAYARAGCRRHGRTCGRSGCRFVSRC